MKDFLIFIVTLWIVLPSYANVFKPTFSAEASMGVEYDSNLSVTELEVVSSKSDNASEISFETGYKVSVDQFFDFSVGYSHRQSMHQEFDQFDISTDLLSAGAAYKIATKTTIGLNYYYADSSLGGDDYLNLRRLNPFVSHYFSDNVFFRGNVAMSKKQFEDSTGRDADVDDLGGVVYYFLDKSRRYVSVGYRYRQEDSQRSLFDFESHQIKARWLKKTHLFEKKSKLKLGLIYEHRDYDDTASANGRRRSDDRLRLSAAVDMSIAKKQTLTLDYEYSDFDSTLSSLTYTQNLLSIRYGYIFY